MLIYIFQQVIHFNPIIKVLPVNKKPPTQVVSFLVVQEMHLTVDSTINFSLEKNHKNHFSS